MKKTRRFLAFLLAMVMVLGLTINVAAADYSITITNTSSSTTMVGNTYTVYKLFNVTTSGTGNDTTYSYTMTNEFKNFLSSDYCTNNNIASEAELVTYLEGLGNNSSEADAFAEAALSYIKKYNQTGVYPSMSSGEAATETATITLDSAGYYLVTGQAASTANNTEKVVAACMLDTVTDNTKTIELKADIPTLDKTIVEDGDTTDYNNAAIGDTVTFKLTSKVPDMNGYNKYYFVVNDTLSAGLTFKNDVAVTIDTEPDDITITPDVTVDGNKITIVLTDFINYKAHEDKDIIITYTATVDSDAVIGTTGNDNTATLTYSNNPTYTYEDEDDNDQPDDNEDTVTGTTPVTTTYTYVTGIQINKEDEEGNKLTGAQFKLEGDSLNTVIVETETFTEDEGGTYYKLKEGTYTETEPSENTKDSYESTSTKYTKTTNTNSNNVAASHNIEATVGDDGTLVFEGLSEGVYKITELVAPDGYNKLENPLYVYINWIEPANSGDPCTWEAYYITENAYNGYAQDGIADVSEFTEIVTIDTTVNLTVQNTSGSILPSTGGIGTTIFYIVGGVLVFGAIVFFVTKKRMDSEE